MYAKLRWMKAMFSYDEIPVYDPRPHSSHTKIIRCIQRSMRVLDVGCATGYLAKELKRKNCDVVGIEINQAMADIAVQYCDEVVVADVENVEELSFSPQSFDVIMFSDILEHLKRPDLALINLKRYLKSDGFVIASIPNIARLEFRLKLLFGKFDYKQTGILNKGHLRFFTLRTAKNLFETTGYAIVKIEYTGLASKFKILPTLLTSQFVIMARPSLAI
jgi:2-polyprenyl-3-methyl-5-hydroxy-6-metoxy-1,4-benzoquinol methylase